MTITKTEIREKFVYFNEKFFENKLAVPTICFKNNKDGVVGKFRCWKDECRIYINRCIEWTEKDLDDVIVHEMIHYYISKILNKNPLFSHGFLFRKIRRDIKKKGLKVHIRYNHLKYKKESRLS